MPELFGMTGVQKSGNSWIYRMIRALDGARDFDPVLTRLRLHWLNHSAINFRKLSGQRVRATQLLSRVFDPESTDPFEVDEAGRRAWLESLLPLARSVRLEIARAAIPFEETVPELRDRLLQHLISSPTLPPLPVDRFVVAAKHTPLDTLLRAFPDRKIIWVTRDPRDSLTSFFYHDLATLDRDKIDWFVEQPSEAAAPRVRDNWLQRFLERRSHTLGDYYRRSLAGMEKVHDKQRVLRVGYEETCIDCPAQLLRIAEFLELDVNRSQAEAIATKFSVQTLTQGQDEQQGSFIRKGRPGGGTDHLSRSLAENLAPEFLEAVTALGYEPSDRWARELPAKPRQSFELSRFCPTLSTLAAFEKLWLDRPDLQSKFNLPYELKGLDTFYGWLQASDLPEVKNYRQKAQCLEQTYGSIPEERHSFEYLMRFS